MISVVVSQWEVSLPISKQMVANGNCCLDTNNSNSDNKSYVNNNEN
jgi:hypothetical protein